MATALKRGVIALVLSLSSFHVLANALVFESLIQTSLRLDFELSQIQDTMSSSLQQQIPVVVDASALQKVQAITAMRVYNSSDSDPLWVAPAGELTGLLSVPYFSFIPVSRSNQAQDFTVEVEWFDRKAKPKQALFSWRYSPDGYRSVVLRLSSLQRGRVNFMALPVERTKARQDTRSPLTVWESLTLQRIQGLLKQDKPQQAFLEFSAATAVMPRLNRLIIVQVTEAELLTALRLESQAATVLSRGLFSGEQEASLQENTIWLRLAKLNLAQQQLGMAARRLAKMRLPDAQSLLEKEPEDAAQWRALIQESTDLKRDMSLRQGIVLAPSQDVEQDIYWALNHFNLGALHARKQRFDEAEKTFVELTSLPLVHALFGDPRFVAIYEKAWLNLGYVYLAREQYSNAMQSFQQLRMASPFAIEGAMGAGWAANKQEQFGPSLTPWRWLLQLPALYPYQPAALLGIADVYERQSQFEYAMAAYQVADQQYTEMIARVSQWLEQLEQSPDAWLSASLSSSSVLTGDTRCDVASIDMAAWVSHTVVNRRFQTLCLRRQYAMERQDALQQRLQQIQIATETLSSAQRMMFESPVAMLQQQVQLLIAELHQAQREAEALMRAELVKNLASSQEKVSHYQLAARLASARLSDVQSGGNQ